MADEIQYGDKIRITVGDRSIEGTVRAINGRYRGGNVGPWNSWDIEYAILSRDYITQGPRGNYGRWRQNEDGGTVERL